MATRRRSVLVRVLAFVSLLLLVAPGLAPRAFAQDGKVLRVAHSTYPDVLDPQKSSYTFEIDVLTQAYEGLTRLDAKQNTVPGAAESWKYNDDATTLTFTLRPDLKYSDGSPLTAENFRYAVERTCSPRVAGDYQAILFEIVGCEDLANLGGDPSTPTPFTDADYDAAVAKIGAKVIDDKTLELTFTHPAPYFHTIASTWVFYPVKKEIADADPDNWWKTAANHIGNGPFKITGIDEDQEITFAANDNYWQGRPKLDGLDYRYIDDTSVALQAFRTGDLDIVPLDPPQIPEVMSDPELSKEFVSYSLAGTQGLQFNLSMAPFTDKKVREAFSMAFDRETFCKEIRGGDCTPTLSWIPPGVPGHIEFDKFGFDPDAAKAALAASSYGSGDKLPPIKMYFNSDQSGATERGEWVAGQFRDILGVTIDLMPTDGTTLSSMRKQHETYPQMLLTGGWTQDYPDPQNWMSVYWGCETSFAKNLGYCNPDLDALMLKGDTTVDPAKRLPYYEQAGQLLAEDTPFAFLFNPSGVFVVSSKVTGYTPSAGETLWPGAYGSQMTIDIRD